MLTRPWENNRLPKNSREAKKVPWERQKPGVYIWEGGSGVYETAKGLGEKGE